MSSCFGTAGPQDVLQSSRMLGVMLVLMLTTPLPRAVPPWPQAAESGELTSFRSWGNRVTWTEAGARGSAWGLRVLCKHRFYLACH